jgi:hypothetical protein
MSSFKSLSQAINVAILQAQQTQTSNINMSTNTRTNMGYGKTKPDVYDNDQDVLTWGNSIWGVQKVTAFYKPVK